MEENKFNYDAFAKPGVSSFAQDRAAFSHVLLKQMLEGRPDGELDTHLEET